MVVLNEGLNKIRDLMSASIDEGDWGTGTASELPSDAGLQTEIVGVEVSSTNSVADKTIQVTSVLLSTAGTGNVITEHVVRFSDGSDLSRTTFTGVTKTASKEIHNIETFVLTQGNI